MSTRTVPQVTIGELVDVQIRGARVENLDCPGNDTFATLTIGSYPVSIALHAPGVTVERVAPGQWPPKTGDVWEDRNKAKWFGTTRGDGVRLTSAHGDMWSDFGEVLRDVGPMRLLYRDGWTPATETTPAEADPEQIDERAQLLAGLRKLVDLLESNPALPAPNSVRAQYSYYGDDETQRAEIERDAAILGVDLRSWTVRDDTGDTAISGDLLLDGHVLYTLYARVSTTPTATQPDEPVEDDQADADPEAPVPAAAVKSTWTCAYCPFTTHDADAGLAHIADHEAGRAFAMTDAQLADTYAALPHRAPDPDAASVLAQSLADGAEPAKAAYRCEGCGKTSRIVAHAPGCPVAAAFDESLAGGAA